MPKKGLTPAPIAKPEKQNTQLARGFSPLETNMIRRRNLMSLTGFTLLEVLISSVLISMILAGMGYLFVTGKRYVAHARSRMTGGELGRVFLDPLQMQVRQDQWLGQPTTNCLTSDGVNTNCDTASQLVGPIPYTPTYEKTPVAGTDLRRVRLTINWPPD